MKTIESEKTRVLRTGDYSIFKPNNQLRFSQGKLQILIGAMKDKNLSKDLPIIVDENYNILDGRYRFEANKYLQEPIYYKVSEGANLIDLMRAKEISFKPTLFDYLIIHQDKLAYRKVYELAKESPISFVDMFNYMGQYCDKKFRSAYSEYTKGEVEWEKKHEFAFNNLKAFSDKMKDKYGDLRFSLFFLEQLESHCFNIDNCITELTSLPYFDKWIEMYSVGHPEALEFEDYCVEAFHMKENNGTVNDVTDNGLETPKRTCVMYGYKTLKYPVLKSLCIYYDIK